MLKSGKKPDIKKRDVEPLIVIDSLDSDEFLQSITQDKIIEFCVCLPKYPLLLLRVVLKKILAQQNFLFMEKMLTLGNMGYVLLSMLVARYQLIKVMHDQQFPERGCGLSRESLLLIKSLTQEKEITEDSIENFQGDRHFVINYLERLPFPYNIKCISEALSDQTNYHQLFDVIVTKEAAGGNMDLLMCLTRNALLEKLDCCHVIAAKNNLWSASILPEVKAILSTPHLRLNHLKIMRFLKDSKKDVLSENSLEWLRRDGEEAKTAVFDFINAIPNEFIQEKYQQRFIVKQLSHEMVSFEPSAIVQKPAPTPVAGRLLAWIRLEPLSNSAEKYAVVDGINLQEALFSRK